MPRSRPPSDVSSEFAENIQTAVELRKKALELVQASRSADAIKLLREALRALPLAAAGDAEVITARIRVLATLAFAEAENSVADGLVHLGTANDLISGLPESQLRMALQGLVDHQHAAILLRTKRTGAALRLFDRAIPMLEQAEGSPAGNPELLAVAYMNRGFAYIELGKPGPAELDMLGCLSLATEYDLPTIKGMAQGNLGEIAQLVGDIPGALVRHEEAERSFRMIAPGRVPRTQIDQARALLAAGVPDEAARHLDDALPVLRQHRNSQDLAEAELARAAAALLQGELELAKRSAGSAHRRLVKRGSAPWAEVASLTKMQAEIAEALEGRPSNASPAKAARLAERLTAVGLPDEAAKATMLAVRLAIRRGSIGRAERLLAEVPSPRKIAPIDHKMLLRLCRAELAVAKGDHRRALTEARAGLGELSRVRDRMGGLDLLCGTAVHGWQLGALAVRLVLENAKTQADARRLLAWQERTRAQVYRYEPLPEITDEPELVSRVAELRTVLRTLQQARLERRPVAQLERRSVALQREVSRLGWHTSHWGRPRPVSSPAEIIERLEDRALISFTGPGKMLAAVVVSGGRTDLVQLGPLAEVLEMAKQLHADLDALAPDDLVAPLAAAVSDSARRRIARLDELLRPVIERIDDRDLVIVPGGGLYQVPWGALPSLRGRAVSVAPSATAWVGAATRPVVTTGEDVVLVCGPGLPESVTELSRLRTIYPKAVVLEGEQATTSNVLSTMDGAKLVHIAAHGTHEPANALFSRLELANGGLLAHELSQLQKPPEHVVLASCELALSNIRPGDEALGFAGAMLASGSRTVVAAVCRVGDRSSAETMTDYHRWLADGPAADLVNTMADYHTRLASGTAPAMALAQATAADPLRRPFICLGAG